MGQGTLAPRRDRAYQTSLQVSANGPRGPRDGHGESGFLMRRCGLMAGGHPPTLFGPPAMSDLSPQCATKRTSLKRYEFISSRASPARGRSSGPCRLLAQPSSILVPLDGRAALNIPHQTEQYLPRAARPTSPGLAKGRLGRMGITQPAKAVSVVRIFGRSARKVGETAAAGAGSARISPLRPRGRYR
jgi:hypothetical protein